MNIRNKFFLAAAACFVVVVSAYAQDSKVSALTALATTPADADEFYIVDGGVSKKITYGTLKADFATAAQGTLAASAVQPADNVSDLTNDAGYAAQLSDLSDVNTSTATNRNVLVADGIDWESRALVEADISDFGTYLTAVEGTDVNSTGPVTDGYVLTADGAGGAAWEAAAGGGGTPGGSSGDIQYNNGGSFAGSYLKQGTNVIEQRNSTNAQTFQVFSTYTDASNYSRIAYSGTGIVPEAAGTGTQQDISLGASGSSVILSSENDATTPTLAFGDGDTGFYEVADDNLWFAASGTAKYEINTARMGSVDNNGGTIVQTGASATSPSLVPRKVDLNTGVGSSGNDSLSLITGGVEQMRLDSGVFTLPTTLTVATLPSCSAAGVFAHVSDGDAALAWGATVVNSGAGATPYAVWCNGTNWTVYAK